MYLDNADVTCRRDASSIFLPVAAFRNKTSEKPDVFASTNDFTTFKDKK